MKEIIKLTLLIFLSIAAFIDLKTQKISVIYIAIGFSAGAVLQLCSGTMPLYELAGGCMIGGVVVLLAYLSKQQIGYGDGMVLIASGVFLGILDNGMLLIFALFMSSAFGTLFLIRKKKKRKDRIPFLPFLFAGYIGILLLG